MPKLTRSLVLSRELKTRWTSGQLRKVNGSIFASICQYDVLLVSITGETVGILKAEPESEDDVIDVVVEDQMRFAITSHQSLLLKLWLFQNDEWDVAAQWKCPGKFPAFVKLDHDSQFLACATAGQSCYFFNLQNQSLVRRYEIPKGTPSAMAFDAAGHLWIGDDLGHVCVIDLELKKAREIRAENAHHKRVTSIVSIPPYVVTAGLDEVALVFDEDGESVRPPVAVYYSIHDMTVDLKHQNCVYVATPDGVKRVDIEKVAISKVSSRAVNQLFVFDGGLYGFDDDKVMRTIGSRDHRSLPMSMFEVYDVAMEPELNLLAVATASHSYVVHVFGEDETFQLSGHTDTPIALATWNGFLLSGARDHTAKIWSLSERKCLTTLIGHADNVLAVAFVPNSDCVITGSVDKTLKLWRPTDEEEVRSALASVIAHDREINAIAVSVDGTLVATGSQDKTAKLWQIVDDKIKPIRTLGAHRRGVSTVCFSPVERVLATGGGDATIKLWSVEDGSCLSTFTEFSSTVMKLFFINNGLQIALAESKGAIKVIRTKTGAPDFSMDEAHTEHIWGLCEDTKRKRLISGAEDGRVCVWSDNTEELEEREMAEKAEAAEADQDLRNALRSGEYLKALRLAFKLRMPAKLRLVVREISERGLDTLIEYFTELDDISDYEQWMDYVSKWSTNSRWADDATEVISALVRVKPISFFTSHKRVFQAKIDAIIPYLERHSSRLDRLNVQTYALDDIIDTVSLE